MAPNPSPPPSLSLGSFDLAYVRLSSSPVEPFLQGSSYIPNGPRAVRANVLLGSVSVCVVHRSFVLAEKLCVFFAIRPNPLTFF